MKAAVLNEYNQPLEFEDRPEPEITRPDQVRVKIEAAGVCSTDLHAIEGEMGPAGMDVPRVLGHENGGRVDAVGDLVTTVEVGDPVLIYPPHSCGVCVNCRRGRDMHCEHHAVHRAEPRRRIHGVPGGRRAGDRPAARWDRPRRRRAALGRRDHRLSRAEEGRTADAAGHHRGGPRRRGRRPHRPAARARARLQQHRGGRPASRSTQARGRARRQSSPGQRRRRWTPCGT